MSALLASLTRALGLHNLDADEIFSYQTTKVVSMLDHRLGLLCWSIRLLVVGYIVGFVFVANEGYTEREVASGHVLAQVDGATFSMSRGAARAWDHLDAVRPPLEGGAVFVGTQALVSPRQRMGNCTTPAKKCAQDADCERRPPLAAGKCFSGMCVEMQWCPAQAEGSSDATEVHSLEGADAFAIWLRASIQFTTLDAHRIFSTISAQRPRRAAVEERGVRRILRGPGALRVDVERQEHRRLIRRGPWIVRRRRCRVGRNDRDARERLTLQH